MPIVESMSLYTRSSAFEDCQSVILQQSAPSVANSGLFPDPFDLMSAGFRQVDL